MTQNGSKTPKRLLTAKQERFAQLVASGEKHVDAYRQSHGGDDNAQGIHTDTYQLASSPHVALRIQELNDRYAAVAEINSSYVLERVKATAEDAEREKEHSPALKGYELLGRHVGLFQEHSTVDVRVEHTLDDATREDLRAMLTDLQNQRLAIQASAEVVDDESASEEKDV